MSCCGQAKDQPGVATNGQLFPGAGPGIIDSQPTYQHPPSIPSPPITQLNPFLNGMQPPMQPPMQSPMQPPLQPPMRVASPSQQSAGHIFTGSTLNGQAPFQQPTFTGSTFNNGGQPPMREFGASSPFQLQTAAGTNYNGSIFNGNQSITRPKSSHSPYSPPPQVNAPLQDEGKMSVSIDFGVYPHITSLHTLILVQAQHSLVL